MRGTKVFSEKWYVAKLLEVALVNPKLDKKAISDDIQVSFVPMPAVQAENGVIDVSSLRKFSEVKKGYTPFRQGDILFAKITPCMENGKMAVVPEIKNGIGFGSTEFHVLRALSGINEKYIYYYVSSQAFRHAAEHNMTGAVGQRRVPTGYLSECDIPLPPTKEQNRIVAKIEELFSELDQGIDNLKTAQAQLKVYRQALLKHAFEGKLTAEWRTQNAEKLESASALQQRIQRARAQRHQQQLAEWEANGKQGTKPKAPKPIAPLTAEGLAELPELPEGWVWVSFSSLVESSQNGISKRAGSEGKETVVLRLADIAQQKISVQSTRKILLTEKEIANYRLNKNDLICIRVNGSPDLVGRMVTVEEDTEIAYCDHFIRYRLLSENCNSKYIANYFDTVPIRRYIDLNKVSSAGQNTVNQEMLGSIAIALCSTDEQSIILDLLEERFSQIDQLEQTITTALQQADALRQSILKKAFSGELVPQDPNDEPAAALLARIKTLKSEVNLTKRVGK